MEARAARSPNISSITSTRCGWRLEIGFGGLHSLIKVPNARQNCRAKRADGNALKKESRRRAVYGLLGQQRVESQ